jgi:hypothetical protein
MSMCYRVPTVEGNWQPVDFKGGQSFGKLQDLRPGRNAVRRNFSANIWTAEYG